MRQKHVGSVSWLHSPNFHPDNFTVFYFFHFYFVIFQMDASLFENVWFRNTKAVELQEELSFQALLQEGDTTCASIVLLMITPSRIMAFLA